jgi:hypothetical protein
MKSEPGSVYRRKTSILAGWMGAVALVFFVPQALEAAKKSGAAVTKAGKTPPHPGDSSAAVESDKAQHKVEIEVDAKFLNLNPEGLQKISGNAPTPSVDSVLGVFSEEGWAKCMEGLMKENGTDVLASPRITVRSGQKALVEVVRAFQFPTDWAKNPKKGGWEPKKFGSESVGIRLGVLVNQKVDGTLELSLEPELNAFQGWLNFEDKSPVSGAANDAGALKLDQLLTVKWPENSEGRRLQPIFSRRKTSVHLSLTGGQTVLMSLAAKETGEWPVLVAVTPRVHKPVTEVPSLTIRADSVSSDAGTGVVTAEGNVEVETPEAVLRSARIEFRARTSAAADKPDSKTDQKAAEPAVDVPAGTPFKLTGAAVEKIAVVLAGPVHWKEKPLGEVLAILHQWSVAGDPAQTEPESKGVHFVLELPDGTEEPKVTLDLENPTLLEVVEAVARAAGLRVTAEPAGFHFGVPRSVAP